MQGGRAELGGCFWVRFWGDRSSGTPGGLLLVFENDGAGLMDLYLLTRI